MLIGYGRTSTTDQAAGIEAQERGLLTAGCDKLFIEQVSSVGKRRELEAALDYAREGDTLVVTKLDRLARSVADLLSIVGRLEAKKVALRVQAMSGSRPLDTGTAIGKLMLAVIGAVGQFEREMMLERQREGIAKAKREGRYKGRVPTARRQTADIIKLREAGVTPSEIAVRLGVGRASVYRVLGEQARVAAWVAAWAAPPIRRSEKRFVSTKGETRPAKVNNTASACALGDSRLRSSG